MPRQTNDNSILQADLTTSPARVQLRAEARHSFAFGLYFETADAQRVNITGCTITFTAINPVWRATGIAVTKVADIVDGPNGHAQVNLQAVDLDLLAGQYEFDVTLLTPEAYSNPIFKGYLEVVANPDPGYVDEVYDAANPPDSLTTRLFDNHTVGVVVNHLSALTLEVGSVTTLPTGSDASAGIIGDYPHQILNLGLPRGEASTVPGPSGPAGPQGTPGTTGSPGATGPQGAPGATGATGPAGPTGPASTVPGPTGPAGPQGLTGPSGPASTVPGPTGPAGPQGLEGPAGAASTVAGPTGPKGDPGTAGATGATGAQGPKGDTGATGSTGAQGSPGTPGTPGATGAQGPKGDKGDPGATGSTGATGPQGSAGTGINVLGSVATVAALPPPGGLNPGDAYTVVADGHMYVVNASRTAWTDVGVIQGPKGDPGATGAQGPKGDTGAAGTPGATGATGSTGAQGIQGNPGATGAQGVKGDPGVAGPQGVKGDTGATGSTGPAGTAGATGPQGLQGNPGATGPTGAAGTAGATGPQGPQGNPGATGSTGAQGPKGDTGAAGADGATGAQGPKGDKGDQGIQGIQGIQGVPGVAADSGWLAFTMGNGDPPWGGLAAISYAEYRVIGRMVYIRFSRTSAASAYTGSASGNFANIDIAVAGAVPAAARPTRNQWLLAAWNDLMVTLLVQTTGAITICGGIPSGNYGSATVLSCNDSYSLD
jgi:hypothetical protein